MIIECKKTTELSDAEIRDYCESFTRVFPKHIRTVDKFKSEYVHSSMGYSYHILLKNDEGKIVGGYSASPFNYEIDNKTVLIASGADFMIEREYRNDIRNVIGLIKSTESYLKENGVACLYGFPNEYSYKLNLSLMKMKAITSLDTYILPLKIGDAKPSLKLLNPFSWLASEILLFLSYFDLSSKELITKIRKKRPEFDEYRYKWYNPDDYKKYQNDRFKCVWKISQFEGVKACFLIDIFPYSKRNFGEAVRKMVSAERDKVGIFLYVGNLPSHPISMIKVPHKIEPKTIRFVAKVLDKTQMDEADMLEGSNWDLNLSSYDLV